MEPSVSIHHFVHPQWFEELGGWTKEENIELYVKFAVEAFKRFGKHAKLWSSFNEPTVCTVTLHAGPPSDQSGTHHLTECDQPVTKHWSCSSSGMHKQGQACMVSCK